MKVTVTRAFLLRGEFQAVGTTVEVGDALGRELIAMNKAAPANATKAPAGPMTTVTAAAVVAGKTVARKTTTESKE